MSSPTKYTLILSPDAIEDRTGIVAYTVAQWGAEQAKTYNAAIRRALATIRANPAIGRVHPQLPPTFRVYHVERHYIVYTVADTTIGVARILHDQMDIARHIPPP